MSHVLVLILGVIGGAVAVFVALEPKRRKLEAQRREQEARGRELEEGLQRVRARGLELDKAAARAVAYNELQDENTILKRDLQNVEVNLRKLQLDRDLQRRTQEDIDRRSKELGKRHLAETVKWVSGSLTTNNFVNCNKRLQTAIESVRGIGFPVSADEEADLLAKLREDYERTVRAAFEREEQARIKAQIREEQRLQREVERELKSLERERAAIAAALEKALAETKDEHSAEVERLKARLSDAEAKAQRTISQAQLTKAGYVYVISNIGSFGDSVFKIGMTRRLEPSERIRELGDASVPFPFDVHMMISCNNAPALENAIHRMLHKDQINRVNPRKEFFRTDIEAIRAIVTEHHGEVEYVADAEALEYRQSLEMSDADQEYIEGLYESLGDVEDDGESQEESS